MRNDLDLIDLYLITNFIDYYFHFHQYL